jgi:alanyl-tRNA synthetase
MSEMQAIEEMEVQEVETQPTPDLTDILAENERMRNQLETLLTETKRAKQAKREAEAQAEADRERIAKEKGDFEALHRSAEERYKTTAQELETLRVSISNEKRDNAAMRIAAELADGSNAELLSDFISRRLKYHEDGVKVTDAQGNLTVSSLDDLKAEFKSNPKYSALLKGNQSSGGGASGGSNSGGAAKVKTRAEFEALNAVRRMEFVKAGGEILN